MPKSQGMTLVEVLIALTLITVLSTGFMVASLQALRVSEEVRIREAALLLVRDGAERLRIHQLTWAQTQTLSGVAPQSTSVRDCYRHTCTPKQLAVADWQQLIHRMHRQLPEAQLHLQPACGNGGAVSCLWVTWRGAEVKDCVAPQRMLSRHGHQPSCLGVTLWLPGGNSVSS